MWNEGQLVRFVGMLLKGKNLGVYVLAAVSPFVLYWGAFLEEFP